MVGCASINTSTSVEFSLDEALQNAATEIEKVIEPGKRIAVVNIDTGSPAVSNYIVEELIGQFVRHKKITVIDRNNINLLQKELSFNMSGYVSDETAQSIGKIMGARFIVSGSLLDGETAKRFRLTVTSVDSTVPEAIFTADIRKDAEFEQLFAGIQNGNIIAVPVRDRGGSISEADKYLSEAEACLEKGDYVNAIAGFTKVIEILPDYAFAYNNRSSMYVRIGENDKAIADCTAAIALVPKYPGPYSNRSAAYFQKGNYDKAIEDANMTISIDPKFSDAYVNRGNAYHKKGDVDRAIADCTYAIKIDPKSMIAYNNLAIVYSEKGDYKQAMVYLIEGLKIEPTNAHLKKNLGIVAWQSKTNQ
jgi:tetratricopeptide (TPR) repeat protein